MNNLRNALGELAYRELAKILKGITNGGVNAIKIDRTSDFPFMTEDEEHLLYTDLQYDETASEDNIQHYQRLIDDNIKVANTIIQNYNNDKFTVFIFEDDNGKNIFSVNLQSGDDTIYIMSVTDDILCKIPVNFSEDGKAIIRDYPYTIE